MMRECEFLGSGLSFFAFFLALPGLSCLPHTDNYVDKKASVDERDELMIKMATNAENQNSQRYPVDVRLFGLVIVSVMAIAFAVGALLGSTPVFPTERMIPISATDESDELPTCRSTSEDHATTGRTRPQDQTKQTSGKHLMVDLKNVDGEFLNSEHRLVSAMVEVVHRAELKMLSYHCHQMQPAGVSCVGVLLNKSHISFHTWPDEGVITLDLFTTGSNTFWSTMVSLLQELFGIPRVNAKTDVVVESMWSHDVRGFINKTAAKPFYLDASSDLSRMIMSPLDLKYKKEIVSVQSDFQHIDVWDILEAEDTPSYDDTIEHKLKEGDLRLLTTELASPERLLFLDGALQSMKEEDHECHESFVHPAMFAHPNPRRVAIVGGGDGGALREILKHTTVEVVKMIEIDQMVTLVAREHLPFFSNCSDLVNSVECCFDDPRANIEFEDGKKWFIETFGGQSVDNSLEDKKIDVIFLDLLNPEGGSPNSNRLYEKKDFLTPILNSLTDDGLIVLHAGIAPTIHSPSPDKDVDVQRENLFLRLENHPDTRVMLVYEEIECHLYDNPSSFLVVCKSFACRKKWYEHANAIDFRIYERITATHSGEPALKHFDGSTQYNFQYPPKAWETVYCRREPQPTECAYRGLNMNAELRDFGDDEEDSDFYIERIVQDSREGDFGVFANNPIRKGDYIMPSDLASSFVLSNESKRKLNETIASLGSDSILVLDKLLAFVDKHGHDSIVAGLEETVVETGHSIIIRRVHSKEDANVGRWVPRTDILPTFSPVYERNRRLFDVFLVATRDIDEGEELLRYEDFKN